MNELISKMAFDLDYTKFYHREHQLGFFNENGGDGWAYYVHIAFGYNGKKLVKKPYYEVDIRVEILGNEYREKKRVYSDNVIQAFQDACTTTTKFLLKIQKNEQ